MGEKMKRIILLVLVSWFGGAVCAQQGSVDESAVNHVQAIQNQIREETGASARPKQVVARLNRLVVKYYQDGDYRTALAIAQQTAHYAERNLGPEHPDMLNSVNNLAFLYNSQGRHGEAEPLYER
ncbi:MAG TPA: tetratricopeptide repeat protein, partial [Gammaproteobacteria bacterium]|nr:tetratricopeptide repeat protein [Gammaproteobacteria bacterium]